VPDSAAIASKRKHHEVLHAQDSLHAIGTWTSELLRPAPSVSDQPPPAATVFATLRTRLADWRTRGEQAVHFQPETGRIVFSANTAPVPWQPGAQDRLSLPFQLSAMIAAEPARFAPGAQVSILTASARSAEPWVFAVMDSQPLDLPIGLQNALRLRREPRHPYDQAVEIWFAPALGHLPVRILLSQGNGDVFDQRLSNIKPAERRP
jgi:hypothetical protein